MAEASFNFQRFCASSLVSIGGLLIFLELINHGNVPAEIFTVGAILYVLGLTIPCIEGKE